MSNESREELIRQVGHEIAEFQSATDALDDAVAELFGMNRTDQRCLGVLFMRGPMTAGQLADAAGLSAGAMTTVLDRLERAGAVRRMRDEHDRRRVLVEPTPEVQRIASELYGPIAEEGTAELRRATREQLVLIRDFLRDARALQERHAARVRAMLPPPDVRTSIKAAAKEAKAAANEVSMQWKAAKREMKLATKGLKADLKAELKGAFKPPPR